jgi:uncharacterized protein
VAEEKRPTALVTGATAGIGAAFARRLATDGHDLVLVARDEDRLRSSAAQLSATYGVSVTVLPADLAEEAGIAAVEQRLRDPDAPVDVLVNNAGIGLRASFLTATLDDEARQLQINVTAVMRLTHAALPVMTERRHGTVINVSSVAGFGAVQPGYTYAASKAWVTNFSESLGQLTRRYGVRVMAVCPGFTRTELHQRAGIDMSSLPGWVWLKADDVVAAAFRDLARGRLVSVPDWKYKAAAFGLRHAPRRLLAAAGGNVRIGR